MKEIQWAVRPKNIPHLKKRCPKCGALAYENSGCFRVNANGRRLDIWLIYRCAACKATWNLTVMERVDPKAVDKALYERFLANDASLAMRYGLDIAFLKRNGAEFDRDSLLLAVEGETPAPGEESLVTLVPEMPLDIPVGRLLAQGLGVSQSAVKRMLDAGVITADWELKKAKLVKPLSFRIKPAPHEAGIKPISQCENR